VNGDLVRIWLIRTDLPDRLLADLVTVLDDEERGRASTTLGAGNRRRFVVAHAALRIIVGEWLGTTAEQVRWQRGRNGKPELAGEWSAMHVNLSHSGELAVVAATESRPVGVDVQRLLPDRDSTRLAVRYFPPAEARFVAATAAPGGAAGRFGRLWTRKEACIKASGGRLAQGLALPVHGTDVVEHPGGPLPGPYLVADVQVPQGFRAAVALEGSAPYRVVRAWWRWPAPAGTSTAETPSAADTSMADRHR
jgi:4'-phosphopantetheinyl transferase